MNVEYRLKNGIVPRKDEETKTICLTFFSSFLFFFILFCPIGKQQ